MHYRQAYCISTRIIAQEMTRGYAETGAKSSTSLIDFKPLNFRCDHALEDRMIKRVKNVCQNAPYEQG